MNPLENSPEFLFKLLPVIFVLSLWDAVWKVVGMWKSARRNQLVWFICIALFNTLGVLPIVYLILSKNKQVETTQE